MKKTVVALALAVALIPAGAALAEGKTPKGAQQAQSQDAQMYADAV